MKKLYLLCAFILSTLSFTAMSAGDASEMEGKDVVDNSGTKVGDVDRVAMNGTEKVVVIGLEDSMKEVAVPYSSVKVTTDGQVSTTMSKTQLEALEDIDPTDFTELNDDKGVDDPDLSR